MFDPSDITEALASKSPNTVQCVHGVATATFPLHDGESGVLLKLFGHNTMYNTTMIHVVVSPEEAETLCTQIMGHLLDNNPERNGP